MSEAKKYLLKEVQKYLHCEAPVLVTEGAVALYPHARQYVLLEEYAALEDENAKLRARRYDALRMLGRECDDADSVLQLMGIDADSVRTDGGYLNIGKIAAMLASAPSAPKADDPVKVQLLEALEKLYRYEGTSVDTGIGQMEPDELNEARSLAKAAIAAAKGEGQ